MAVILSIATLLGGIAAIWFFWDKIIEWWGKLQRQSQPEQINLASNPTRNNIERIVLASNPADDWNHENDSVRSVSSYKQNMNLRFEIEYMGNGIQCENFNEPWANRHPDPSATSYWCNLFYGSTLVERFILVAVDGARAMLPTPKKGDPNTRPMQVLPLDHKIAQIHDTLGTLTEYMKRSGLSIYEQAA